MSEDEGFLHTIGENHDDDTPRLIYADWLEEHGNPERAEFIRVQCELARMPEDEDSPRRHHLQMRETILLAEHEETWLGPLGRWMVHNPDGQPSVFRRGFVEYLEVWGDPFVKRTRELFGITPLRGVFLQYLSGALCGRLAQEPLLLRLRNFSLWNVYDGGSDGLASLLESPYLANLESLHFPGMASRYLEPEERHIVLSPERVALLAQSSHLSKLRGLCLMRHGLEDDAVEVLAASHGLRGLTLLNLRDNSIHDRGALALSRSAALQRLQHLDLWDNPIGDVGGRALYDRFRGALVLSQNSSELVRGEVPAPNAPPFGGERAVPGPNPPVYDDDIPF
jgi:uncharacterized protein (TIGR02996 family)